jgi:hypothetical protein
MPHDSPAGEFDEPIRWAPRISHRPIPMGFPEYTEYALLPSSAVYKVQRYRRRASPESEGHGQPQRLDLEGVDADCSAPLTHPNRRFSHRDLQPDTPNRREEGLPV